ncbi:MAG: hypothetical protein O7E52_16870 [Candidatus Poribacteria bacterium]|nr:hypothetical protein [Candidatus Poribacteria bacterium]
MKSNAFENLLQFLTRLEQANISYTLAHHRDEALMVVVAVPGERWEVEFLDDGSVEVERFVSSGEIETEGTLTDLFTIYAVEHDAAQDAELTAAAS